MRRPWRGGRAGVLTLAVSLPSGGSRVQTPMRVSSAKVRLWDLYTVLQQERVAGAGGRVGAEVGGGGMVVAAAAAAVAERAA